MNAQEGIYQYWDVSTTHITANDDKLLAAHVAKFEHAPRDQDDYPSVLYPYDGGYWLFVSDHTDEERKQEFGARGFSDAFIGLLKFAAMRDIWWIKLDSEGNIYDDMPTFDRDEE
jgi:hypothetical protein